MIGQREKSVVRAAKVIDVGVLCSSTTITSSPSFTFLIAVAICCDPRVLPFRPIRMER